ncbi:hypothetical protein PP707_01240, partial [Acetobacter pasteurianus]|nr:hypothetical protein [Acetobacter pasteurianus]
MLSRSVSSSIKRSAKTTTLKARAVTTLKTANASPSLTRSLYTSINNNNNSNNQSSSLKANTTITTKTNAFNTPFTFQRFASTKV